MTDALLDAGGTLASFFEDDEEIASGFAEDHPDVRRARHAEEILDDDTVELVVSASVPRERTGVAIAALERGKDVLLDKPAATSDEQVAALRDVCERSGRHLAVWFDERIDSPAVLKAIELVGRGAIGDVAHVIGTGPHELELFPRPEWFFDPEQAGGILADLGCQQIDIFLALTGALDAVVEAARATNVANPERPGFRDVGDVLLRGSTGAMGYLRVDWLTPSGLGAFGDGRTFVVGTSGTLELRRDIDPAGRGEGHHLFLSDANDTRYVSAENVELPFARSLLEDVADRTETAMTTEHALRVTELSLKAQALAGADLERQSVGDGP
jgi:predicted dehydrogenase